VNLLPDRHAKFVIIQWITCVVPKLANLLMHSQCALSEPISSSRKTGSAKKFVRITSGFGGGEFTKTLCKVCTCQKLKFSFLLLEYCKIRECYAVANAFTIRNMSSFEAGEVVCRNKEIMTMQTCHFIKTYTNFDVD
jgi:hypothetical protein